MREVKAGARRMIVRVLTVFLALGFALGGILPSVAYAGEEEVRAVGEGVFKFNMGLDFVLTDDDGKPIRDAAGNEIGVEMVGRGSAFLINEDTVITCYHCASFSDDFFNMLRDLGYREEEVLESMKYSVTVSRDVEIECTLVNWSKSEDWAIFKLSQTVGGSRPLVLRDSATVKAAEKVWSVGFPADSEVYVMNTYRPDDVTIKNGTVNKPADLMAIVAPDAFGGLYRFSGHFLQTSVAVSEGDSGGPMVDDEGYVIGINESSDGSYYYGVAISDVMTVLDRLQIAYTSIDGPANQGTAAGSTTTTTEPEKTYALDFSALDAAITAAQAVSSDGYTAEPYTALSNALAAAQKTHELTLDDPTDEAAYNDLQGQIKEATDALTSAQGALVEKKGPNMGLIAGICAAVAAAAVIGFLLFKNKKQAAAPAPATPAPTPVAAEPPASLPKAAPAAPVKEEEPGTTVLTDDEPATTILTEDVDGGTLTRMSTNEKIAINRSDLSLGRERSAVDYCLEGNSNISRVHARIIVRDGVVYIVDNNTPNGTFVNNAKLRPGQEQALKSGDIVRLADEKFRYNK